MISVVVVNWNRKELLRACLASVARQAGVEFETIVVDNGSADGSADVAEVEFGARVIRNAQNRGFCAANNQGIAAAQAVVRHYRGSTMGKSPGVHICVKR